MSKTPDEQSGARGLECFVISPIGAEGSETRRHADIVYECIVVPACAATVGEDGLIYRPERGDHKAAPGKITDQIYEDIMDADLIIAVLTESNPNVYYELAIAQAAAKPVILLLEKGFEAPFDIKDQRIIYYDFEPQSIFHGHYAIQLRAAINVFNQRRKKPTVPFAPHLTPLGDPQQIVGNRASEAEEESIAIVANAERRLRFMGYTMVGWTLNDDFTRKLAASAARLVDPVQVLLIGKDNPSLGSSMKNDNIAKSTKKLAQTLPSTWSAYLDSIPKLKHELRLNTSKVMGFQLIMSEKEGIIIPYLTSRDTLRSPYIYTRAGTAYYDAMIEEFEYLWTMAQSPSD